MHLEAEYGKPIRVDFLQKKDIKELKIPRKDTVATSTIDEDIFMKNK